MKQPTMVDHQQVPHQTSREPWQIQKAALARKFEDGWNPRKRLSPDALAGIRALHAQFPEQYPTAVLADKFQVSPEAIRRILKSKWTPNTDEEQDRMRRWVSRGVKIWNQYADQGLKPPTRWRELGVRRRTGHDARKVGSTISGLPMRRVGRTDNILSTTKNTSYEERLSERIL